MSDSGQTIWQRAGSRIVLSLKAALVGWAALIAILLLTVGFKLVFSSNNFANGSNPFVAILLVSIGSGITVFFVWLIVLIPFALLIPERSILWRPGVLAAVGAVVGPIIILACGIYNLEMNPTIQPRSAYLLSGIFFPGIPSAIIGVATGAMATRLHNRQR